MQGPTATLGLYINSGSVYEEPYETGAPQNVFQLLLHAAFDLQDCSQAIVSERCGDTKLLNKLDHSVRNRSDAGCSHLLEYMAFKTTANRTYFRLTREVHFLRSIAVPTTEFQCTPVIAEGHCEACRLPPASRRIGLWHIMLRLLWTCDGALRRWNPLAHRSWRPPLESRSDTHLGCLKACLTIAAEHSEGDS